VRVDHRSRTQAFSTMRSFTCKGVSMMLVFTLTRTDINVPIRRTAHLTLSSPLQVISIRKNGGLKE